MKTFWPDLSVSSQHDCTVESETDPSNCPQRINKLPSVFIHHKLTCFHYSPTLAFLYAVMSFPLNVYFSINCFLFSGCPLNLTPISPLLTHLHFSIPFWTLWFPLPRHWIKCFSGKSPCQFLNPYVYIYIYANVSFKKLEYHFYLSIQTLEILLSCLQCLWTFAEIFLQLDWSPRGEESKFWKDIHHPSPF